MEAKNRIIIHIDLDAFFAACEEVRKPELRGKPVVIGADPKEGKGRGVVSTANYEARKYGIKSAMPISWAYRRCKHAIFLSVDMSYYAKVSQRIMNNLRNFSKKFEQVSIDEMYLDISDKVKDYEKAEKLSKNIKSIIYKNEKLTCSIGIAPNKLLAKIASDFKKPDGLIMVKPYEVKMFLYPLPVDKLQGVGPKTTVRLNDLGIKTIGELQKASMQKLIQEFGKNFALFLKQSAAGIDNREVQEEGERKSVGEQITFEKDTKDKKQIYEALDKMLENSFNFLKKQEVSYKTVTVKIRYEDFETHTTQKTFKVAFKNLEKTKQIAHELLKPFLQSEKKIRLVGASLSGFVG